MSTAKLFDQQYRDVVKVQLPAGPPPVAIVYYRRVFMYYHHTSVVGEEIKEHPYREVENVLFLGSVEEDK